MTRPFGVWLVIAWALIRGAAETFGAIKISQSVIRGFGGWSDVLFVPFLEGVVWLLIAVTLLLRWRYARALTLIWCGIVIAWSSYGFISVALARNWHHLRWGVWVLTIAIQSAIMMYMLQQNVGDMSRHEARRAQSDSPEISQT